MYQARALILLCPLTVGLLLAGEKLHASPRLGSEQVISFSIQRAPLTKMQRRKLGASARNPAGRRLVGYFSPPLGPPLDGAGKAPAIVMVQPCFPTRYYAGWIRLINSWGYATLRFSRCQPPNFEPVDADVPSLDWKEGVFAAYGALHYLAARRDIDAKRIAILSWSRIGMVALSVFNEAGAMQFFQRTFRAAIALYPYCRFARGPHQGPILILAGAKDDWAPAHVCVNVGLRTRRDRHPVSVMVYPKAHHGFDIPDFGPPRFHNTRINKDRFAAPGGTLGYAPEAHADAIKQVRKFLAKQMK